MQGVTVAGIVGTAKNSGKTTTMSYLLRRAYRNDMRPGITGIGYDGEEIDNITLLPKPRLYLEKSTIVTTSENCLKNCTVSYSILKRTGIRTALGEVLILNITHPGILVVAGPNKRSSLVSVIEDMIDAGAEVIFVDGSLNRLVPMSVVDKIVFTTGAARSTDIKFLVEEMRGIETIFGYPVRTQDAEAGSNVSFSTSRETIALTVSSLYDSEDLRPAEPLMDKELRRIVVPNLISKEVISHLVHRLSVDRKTPMELLLHSPITLLLSGEPVEIAPYLSMLYRTGCTITYRIKPTLAGITVNPFYPKPENHAYSEACIDEDELYNRMRLNLRTPVFNIKQHDASVLYSELNL
jgi:hypothetical protein